MLVLAAPAALLPATIIHRLAKRVKAEARQRGCTDGGLILYTLVEGIGLKPFFALRMLAEAGRSVRLSLEQGDLPGQGHHCLERAAGRADGVEHWVRRRLPHGIVQNALEVSA